MVIIGRDEDRLQNQGADDQPHVQDQGEQHNLNVENAQANQIAAGGNLPRNPARNEVSKVGFLRPPKPLDCSGGNNLGNDWKEWIQQYNWFEVATKMRLEDQDVQVATFLTSIGPQAVKIFNTFNCTQAEMESVAAIKQKFSQYFTPKSNKIYERYLLNKMVQEEGESIDEFLTRLKAQGAKCQFNELLDDLLCDRVILGIRCEVLRLQLLGEGQDLNLDQITQRCRASEQANQQLRGLKNESSIYAVKTHYKKETSHQSSKTSSDTFQCRRCGRTHGPRSCPAFKKRCNKCKKDGHFAEMCQAKMELQSRQTTNRSKKVHQVAEESSDDDLFISTISKSTSNRDDEKNWFEEIQIQGVSIKVKLDSGAECNVIPESVANRIGGIQSTSTTRLVTYSGDKIKAMGKIVAETEVRGKMYQIKFIVVAENTEPVLGLASCKTTGLIKRVDAIKIDPDVFKGLGCLKGFEYDIDLIDNPKFEIHAARKIPHAYREAVKNEIDNMIKQEVIREMTEATPAVSPMVVVKQHGKIRVVMDPTDVNRNVLRRHYPLKSLEEITAKIAGSKVFTKLDCKKGFWQVKLSERSQKFLTFATPWGRYSYIKLPMGLCSAPEVFQQIMTKLLAGIEKVEVSMDDILIYANDLKELDNTTSAVIKRIKDGGLTLNKDKCEFGTKRIKFLGHILTEQGVEVDPEKVQAIDRLQMPSNKTELQRLLGMVTYLAKFIPNLSEITQPLRKLLEKDSEWIWTTHQSKAVTQIKHTLASTPVLRFYNVNEDITIQADASSYALGAAILQLNHPVAYVSRSLTKAEINYPQIEKEALAIRFACKKFHDYIYGKKLLVETDHKPLESIFKKPIACAPPRLQRILLDVVRYAPNVVYRKGETMYIADTLSRDCFNDEPENEGEEFEILNLTLISNQAENRLREVTHRDETLMLVSQYVNEGWPRSQDELPVSVKPYWTFRDEISMFNGLLYKGQKVIIPSADKAEIIQKLHAGHQGIQRTLAVARSNVFWLNMAKDLTDYVSRCGICEGNQKSNYTEPMIPKEVPTYPFQIVATDIFKSNGHEYILLVDSYSGYFDFCRLRHQSSKEVIKILKKWFCIFGIPEKLESDNGPQYSSQDFRRFANEWNIRHVTSSPKYPKSNGLAERFVQTAKNMLKKCAMDNSDINIALLNYRNTPRSDVLGSPNQRLMSRSTRSLIPIHQDHLKPKTIDNVGENLQLEREKQRFYHDRNTKPSRDLEIGEKVRLQMDKRKWIGATVTNKTEKPRSYIVRTDDGRSFRRNTIHIHPTQAAFDVTPRFLVSPSASPNCIEKIEPRTSQEQHHPVEEVATQTTQNSSIQFSDPPKETVQRVTRSGRIVKEVVRLNL